MQTLTFILLCVILWQLVQLRRDVQSLDAPVPVLPYGLSALDLSGAAIPENGVCGCPGDDYSGSFDGCGECAGDGERQ